MGGEAFCKKHGPYDAKLSECPYCARQSGGRPQAPRPLEEEKPEEEEPRRNKKAAVPPADDDDLEVTEPKPRQKQAPKQEEEEVDLDETELPRRYRRSAPAREPAGDEDDSEQTELPQRRAAPAPLRPEDEDDTMIDRSETGLLGWLIVKDGLRRGQVYRLHNGITIGRDHADILVRDSKISRPHAKLTVENDQFTLWDFGSENGTFVNGERIRQATPLDENDVIKMGDTTFVLKTLQ